MRLGAQRQALAQLPQLGLLQALFEFGLSHQNDLQQLLGEGLEIGQHADLFQHFVGKVLRLVDDQHRRFAGAIAVEQPVIKPLQNWHSSTWCRRECRSRPS